MITASSHLNSRILIVDDQDVNIRLLTRVLHSEGYTAVSSTTDALEVCELHRTDPYDLILLDLWMPVMDGFEVMDALRKNALDGYIPVFILSAEPRDRVRSMEGGARDFATKPYELNELLARINALLETGPLSRTN